MKQENDMETEELKEILTWEYGVMAVDHEGTVLHCVLFPEDPPDDLIKEIEKEIREDMEFGIGDMEFKMVRMDDYWIAEMKHLITEQFDDVQDDTKTS